MTETPLTVLPVGAMPQGPGPELDAWLRLQKEQLELTKSELFISKTADERAVLALQHQKLELDVEQARVTLTRAQLDLQEQERCYLDRAAEAGRSRTYTFWESVDEKSVERAVTALSTMSRRYPGEALTLVLNSPGGAVMHGLALYDYLTALRKEHELTVIGLGRCASMGGVLLQAASPGRRLIGRNTYVLIHEVSGRAGGCESSVADQVELWRNMQKRLLRILASRSTMSAAQIERKWSRRDWWIDAETALELKFADGYHQ